MPDIIPASLPSEFHRFFWDIDVSKLNPQEKPYYVINRLLDKGNLEAARWVIHTFSKEIIIESLIQAEDISSMTATFFANYFEIPREKFASIKNGNKFRRISSDLWHHA